MTPSPLDTSADQTPQAQTDPYELYKKTYLEHLGKLADAGFDTNSGQGSDAETELINKLRDSAGKSKTKKTSASDTLREAVERGVTDTPQDSLMRLLHMTPEEKAGRGKLGNIGQAAGNFAQSLILGRNFRNEANQDYKLQGDRLQLGATELRNQDVARKADQDRQLRESLGEQLNAAKAAKLKSDELIAAGKKETADEKNSILSDKNDIASAWNEARTGTADAKQKSIDKFNDYKMKHPNERPESFIANAIVDASPDGKLNIGEYQKALNDFYKSQSLRQGPIIKTTEVPIIDPDTNKQTGTKLVPTMINRQTGAVSTPGQPATPGASSQPPAGGLVPPTSTPGTVQYGQTLGGVAVPKANLKTIQDTDVARKSAYQSTQNLLQDFGSGKIDSYTGALNGSTPMKWLRNQGFRGGTSAGEAMQDLLSPENTIRNIRSMSPRLNQAEIIRFDGAHGTSTQSGEVLTRRALIYALNKDYDLQDKKGVLPKVSDGKGGATPINETPEFGVALREVIDGAVKDAKKSKGMVVKAPSISDVVELAKQKIQKGAADKVQDLRNQLQDTGVSPTRKAALADLNGN